MLCFVFWYLRGAHIRTSMRQTDASLPGPSPICSDGGIRTNAVVVLFNWITDFTTEGKRVREALCNAPMSPYPRPSVKSPSTEGTQDMSVGKSKRKPLVLPMEQSGPIQLGSQLQRPVSGRYVPCPLHWSGHWTLARSQFRPPQPGLQRHSPLTQTPWLEQVGSKQSTEKARGRVWSLSGAGP